MFRVKTTVPLPDWRELQLAWWSAIGGYDERQAGNCLYWLFEELPPNHGSSQNSSRSIATGSVASGSVQPHGEQSEDNPGSAVQPAGDMQHGEQGPLIASADAHADGTGARRAGTRRRTGSVRVGRPAAHADHSAGADRGRGWTLVMVAVASFAVGVFVGGYARRSRDKHGSKGRSQTYYGTVDNAMAEQKRQDHRKASVHMRAHGDHL